MKNLGDKTLHQIEKLLTSTKKSPPKKTPNKTEPKSKSPVREYPNATKSPNKFGHSLYQPMERDNTLIQRQLKIIQNEAKDQQNYKIQNKHSFFLNAKNPKPPLYQRTQQIMKDRELWLQAKRQEKQRQKIEKLKEEELQFMQMSTPTKKITKSEAFKLTDRLYKQHYGKTTRMNEQKIQKLKEDARAYRNKPEINETTKQIFKLMSERNELEKDVFQRFKQYDDSKNSRQSEYQRVYRNHYYPFRPQINSTSRMMASHQNSNRYLEKSKHCTSCIAIKHDKSSSSLTKSNRLRSQYEQQPMMVSKFQ